MAQALQEHWDNYYKQGSDFLLASSQSISRFLSSNHPDAPRTALDIGCGTGQLTRELWHRGYKVVGTDVSESAIEIAQSLTILPETELCYKQIDVEQGNTADLPFQPYGLITCKLVYAFMRDKQAFLKKVEELLDDKGIFVVITPLIERTPPERKSIAVSKEEIDLLREQFDQVAWYEERDLGYFVGRRKA